MRRGCLRILAGLVIAVFAVSATVYLLRVPILTRIGGYLIVSDVPQPADAIVVLSGSIPDRILEAVDLYRAGLAPRIILTREPPLPGLDTLRERGVSLPEHHEQNQSIAEQLGVPAAAIWVAPRRAASTFAEAEALVGELRAQGVHRVLLVTSNAHARRARLIFRALSQGDPEILVCPSHYDPFAASTWWQHRGFVRRVVIEYGKLATYLLIDQWRIQ